MELPDPNYRQRGVYRVKRLYQTLRSRIDEALAPHGLSMPLFGALAVLSAEGTLSNTALARLNFVTPQTMARMVTSLETAGLVERDAEPGRVVQLKVSAQGHAKLQIAYGLVKDIEIQMLASPSTDETATFLQGLDRAADNLNR